VARYNYVWKKKSDDVLLEREIELTEDDKIENYTQVKSNSQKKTTNKTKSRFEGNE